MTLRVRVSVVPGLRELSDCPLLLNPYSNPTRRSLGLRFVRRPRYSLYAAVMAEADTRTPVERAACTPDVLSQLRHLSALENRPPFPSMDFRIAGTCSALIAYRRSTTRRTPQLTRRENDRDNSRRLGIAWLMASAAATMSRRRAPCSSCARQVAARIQPSSQVHSDI
jgi:hypothetical protein